MDICEICGKEYEYALSVHVWPNGTKTCRHDDPSPEKKFKGAIVKDVERTERMLKREEQKIQSGFYN